MECWKTLYENITTQQDQGIMILESTSMRLLWNLLHTASIRFISQISQASGTFGKLFRSYYELLSKFGAISFQDYVSQGITHPVFYGDLVYKLRRVKGEANFISSGSKIMKRLRRRQYDPAIIERTIGIVLGPVTTLHRSFLKRCTLTNKAVGTIWRALSKPPQRRLGPDPRPLWL